MLISSFAILSKKPRLLTTSLRYVLYASLWRAQQILKRFGKPTYKLMIKTKSFFVGGFIKVRCTFTLPSLSIFKNVVYPNLYFGFRYVLYNSFAGVSFYCICKPLNSFKISLFRACFVLRFSFWAGLAFLRFFNFSSFWFFIIT